MRIEKHMLTAIVVSTLSLGATPALAAESGAGQPPNRAVADGTETPPGVMAALQRDLGLSAEQVKAQRGLQAKAIELDQALQASLGGAFAGSSYDARTGKLVVSVSDAARVDEVKAAGADARLVKFGKGRLEATKAELDVAAGKAKGSGPAERRPNGPRQASMAGITSWYVDTADNVVHVTVQKGRAKAAKATLAKYGDAVTVEESDLAPTAVADYIDGGDVINGNCSAGINLRNASWGTGYLLTAGHCVNANTTLYGQNWVSFGPVLESWYRSGYDDAIARNDNSGYWIQGPWVDQNPSNGNVITTSSYTDAPVGTYICKAGKTTLWTCGTIQVKNETVNVSGITVYGLTRHNACVEPGDSGGANVSYSGYTAEGVTSAAQLISERWCKARYGQPNVSWYYPIAASLRYYGPRYGVGTWR